MSEEGRRKASWYLLRRFSAVVVVVRQVFRLVMQTPVSGFGGEPLSVCLTTSESKMEAGACGRPLLLRWQQQRWRNCYVCNPGFLCSVSS